MPKTLGPWLYVVLFRSSSPRRAWWCTPFLPGDSLLFAVGAVAAHPDSPIRLGLITVLLVVAAVLGDAVNYAIGYFMGPRVFAREDSWLLNKKHLQCAHDFYEEYGGVTIILARFIPIVRTFAPFVAGIGKMSYRGSPLQRRGRGRLDSIFLLAGWWFGGQEVVQKNFHLVIVAIIVISVLPGVYEYLDAVEAVQ